MLIIDLLSLQRSVGRDAYRNLAKVLLQDVLKSMR